MSLLAELITPTEVINDTFVIVQDIKFNNGDFVKEGQEIIALETSKSVISVDATHEGYIQLLCHEEDEVEVGTVIAKIWSTADMTLDALFMSEVNNSSLTEAKIEKEEPLFIVSELAKDLINANGIDTLDVKHDGIINKKIIMDHLANKSGSMLDIQQLITNKQKNKENILFVGTGLHANTLHTILNSQPENRRHLVGIITHDKSIVDSFIGQTKVIATEQDLSLSILDELESNGIKVIVGYSFKDKRVCKSRERLVSMIKASRVEAVSVIHSSALIEPTAIVGEGAQIAQGAIIGNNVELGVGVIVNSGAIISHDCLIGDNTHIAPGTVLGGNVKVGTSCLIGMNSTVFADVKIENNIFYANMSNILLD